MSETNEELFQQAFSLHEAGRLTEAQAGYEKVLADNPDHAEALHLLGVINHQRGDHDRAITLIQHAIELDSQNPAYHYNLGVVLQEVGKDGEAEPRYRETIGLDPHYISAWVNLGNLLSRNGVFSEASDCHRNALSLQPNEPDHYLRLGNSLKMMGDIEGAMVHFGAAVTLAPEDPAIHSALLFASQYEPGIDLIELSRRHREWWDRYGAPILRESRPDENPGVALSSEERLHSLRETTAPAASDDGPIRIGFVSPDFGNHPVGLFLAPLLERLAGRDDVVTICYSDMGKSDEFSQRNRKAADEWYEVKGIADEALAKQIRADRIAVLFDLTGHSDDNRLPVFARKPAPIQITWAGYVGSTGLETMDYLLTDPFHTPETFDEFHSEVPIRLARDYIPYEPPAYAPEVGPLPLLANGFPTFGCLNNPTKLSFPAIQIWSELLRTTPDAKLLLKYKGMDDRAVRLRLLGLFASQGVSDERIILEGQTPHGEHLDTYNRIDVALDPFPYSSGLSACESLWMGVPVITCPGDTFASRHALSHLSNAGVSGTIAEDWTDYVEIAANLVGNPDQLAKVRETLRGQMAASPLCDLDGYCADFVEAIQEVRKG